MANTWEHKLSATYFITKLNCWTADWFDIGF